MRDALIPCPSAYVATSLKLPGLIFNIYRVVTDPGIYGECAGKSIGLSKDDTQLP